MAFEPVGLRYQAVRQPGFGDCPEDHASIPFPHIGDGTDHDRGDATAPARVADHSLLADIYTCCRVLSNRTVTVSPFPRIAGLL
jgi:hypothetical protein